MKNIFGSVKFFLMEKIHMELIFMHSLYCEVKVPSHPGVTCDPDLFLVLFLPRVLSLYIESFYSKLL